MAWLPLESNPEALNKYLDKIGVTGAECYDVYGFEDDLLAMIPKPHLALLFCFPSDKARELMQPLYEGITTNTVGEKVFFMKQEIENACGTFALFHSLAQNIDKVKMDEKGPFANWYKKAEKLDVSARSKSLSQDTGLATAHETCATSGETPANVEHVIYHFICYTNVDNTLYESDSSMAAPRAIGPTSAETLLKDAGKVCQELMTKLNDSGFSAIALVGKS